MYLCFCLHDCAYLDEEKFLPLEEIYLSDEMEIATIRVLGRECWAYGLFSLLGLPA